MAKLNDTNIGKLRWDASKLTKFGNPPQFQAVSDTEVSGLSVRIYPPKLNGQSKKTFFLKYGVRRDVYKIGAWGEWTLEQARDEARKLRRSFYDHGVDPNKSKKRRIRDEKARETVEQLVAAYLQEHEPAWSDSYTRNNRLHAKRVVAAHGHEHAEDLTRDDVRPTFLKIKKDSPSQAGLFRTFGQGLYRWALDWRRVPEMANPFVLERGNSSAKSQFKTERPKRGRHLEFKKGEATRLFDLLADYDSRRRSDTQSYLHIAKIYLLTGWRAKELRAARYEDIDHDQRTIRNVNPKGSKNGSLAYTTPLSSMAYKLLENLGEGQLGHIRFRKGPLFPGQARDEQGNLEPIRAWWGWDKVIAKDPRMPVCPMEGHVQIRDLRRSAVTWLQECGISLENRTIFKGSTLEGITSRTYSRAGKTDIRARCAQLIEGRIRDVEAGNEATMFDQWRTLTSAAGSAQ